MSVPRQAPPLRWGEDPAAWAVGRAAMAPFAAVGMVVLWLARRPALLLAMTAGAAAVLLVGGVLGPRPTVVEVSRHAVSGGIVWAVTAATQYRRRH